MDVKKLISAAKRRENFRDRILDDNTLLVPSWMKFIGLSKGDVEITGESLYEAFLAWCEKTELEPCEFYLFECDLKKRLRFTKIPGEGEFCNFFFNTNKNLGAVWHLSAPSQPNWYGISPGAFCRQMRWKVDQDYVQKLRWEDRAWLAKFNDEFYNQRFTKDGTDLHSSRVERRERSRNIAPTARDLYSISACVDKDNYIVDGSETINPANRQYAASYGPNGLYYESEDALVDLIDASQNAKTRKLVG